MLGCPKVTLVGATVVIIALVVVINVSTGKGKIDSRFGLSPIATEIGWRQVLDQGVEPLSGVSYIKVSISDRPEDLKSIRYCWEGPYNGHESYTRGGTNGYLEAYVISRQYGPLVEPTYFVMNEAKNLRANK